MPQFVEVPFEGRPIRLEYAWTGVDDPAAPLLVFLHEGLGSLAMWKDFPARLCAAGGYRGLVYSRYGYGASTPRAAGERWTPRFMHVQAQETLPRLFAALGIGAGACSHGERAASGKGVASGTTGETNARGENSVPGCGCAAPWLFGHSDGASIALIHAAHHARAVAGVIAVAPHIMVEDVALASIRRARDAWQAGDLRERLGRYHADPGSAFWGWNDAWLDPAFRDWSIEAMLEQVRCPVLAVQGSDDEYGTLAQVHGLARRAPQAELAVLAGSGHSPHREVPDALIGIVTDFIGRHRMAPHQGGRQ